MSRLSGFPQGLLGLIGSVTFGNNPKELSDAVVPTVDIADLFELSTQVVISDVLNPVPGTGFRQGTPAITVPTGEVWHVKDFSVIAITPAASTITFAPAVQFQQNVLFQNDPVLAIASQTRWSVWKGEPRWFGSGTSFGVYVTDLVGAAVITGISMLVAKVRS